jgi:hypothetical protein
VSQFGFVWHIELPRCLLLERYRQPNNAPTDEVLQISNSGTFRWFTHW